MDSSLRKRFTSPFSISSTTEKRELFSPIASSSSVKQGVPTLTPRSASGAHASKSDCSVCSNRPPEEGLKSSAQTGESIAERGPRQKVCRSLFISKPSSGCDQKPYTEQQLSIRNPIYPEKEKRYKTDDLSRCDFLGINSRNTLLSLVELPIPELLSEVDSAPDCIMQELLGKQNKVEVLTRFDLGSLLNQDAVEKFRSAITPRKVHLSHLPKVLNSGNSLWIQCLDSQDSCIADSRPKNKEKSIQMPMLSISTSSGGSSSNESNIRGQGSIEMNKEHLVQAAYESMFSDSSSGRRGLIRGFSVPRCGRLTNQSYQEQAKEFQEILASKVRQIAEVADCLQRKELLYKILQI